MLNRMVEGVGYRDGGGTNEYGGYGQHRGVPCGNEREVLYILAVKNPQASTNQKKKQISAIYKRKRRLYAN